MFEVKCNNLTNTNMQVRAISFHGKMKHRAGKIHEPLQVHVRVATLHDPITFLDHLGYITVWPSS